MIKPISSDILYNRLGWAYKIEVERRHGTFEKTDNVRKQLANVVRLLTKNDRWGLLIRGIVGNGKTSVVNALKSVVNNLVENHYFSSGDIYDWDWMQSVDAEDLVNYFIRKREKYDTLKTCVFLVVDDLGIEPVKVALYGTDFYPFRELFNYRYKHRLPTIITSNFKESELKEMYIDERFADRFNEMFCATTFRDNSFRK